MGHKVSVVRGVKSDHFYNQQNGINEIWVGDVEVISRLPFGDSDQEQSSWPPGGVPKIPWHHFIIPLHKRDDLGNMASQNTSGEYSTCACDIPLPTTGYAGMYSGMHPQLAYLLGVCFLCVSLSFFQDCYAKSERFLRVYETLSGAKEIPNDKEQLLVSEPSVVGGWLGLDVDIMLCKLRRLCSRSALSLALSIFFFFMGLPAFAAGSENAVAVAFIISKGVGVSVGYIGIYVVLLLFMVGRLVYLTRKLR
ncbi:hypothetical protein N7541_001554 [Penicillium brevicompactum]|uniref:Uncharacterized protein n=1 Tax=Penicillium brevicompactum TaxID=5074 RepID=A0A9W9V3K1_PENBR|nr:hypothetical protein N7541_001554 [Penicillium brevicompactum]